MLLDGMVAEQEAQFLVETVVVAAVQVIFEPRQLFNQDWLWPQVVVVVDI
jgi:hypothetical protein